jgi:hypothetical protein
MSSVSPPNPITGFLQRRWLSLIVAALLAGVGGVVVGGKFAQETYTCVGSILYNRSQAGAPQYQQPELTSIVGLVKSQPVLEDAASRLPWKPPAKLLSLGVQTEAVIGSSSLQFTMRGGNAEQTRASLDAIMQALISQAGELRSRTVGQILASHEAHLRKATEAAEAAAETLNAFNLRNKITVSVDDDLERVRDDVAAVETALETQQTVRTTPEEQLQRRRQLLQEQQDADRAQLQRETELALKRNEFERAKRLHEKRYISDAEFRRIETEYSALSAQNSAAFEQRQARLKQLGEALSAQLNRTAGDDETSPSDPEAEAATARIRAFLAQRRLEADRLIGLRPQADELRQRVVVTNAEVQRAAQQVATFQELRDTEFHDLIVVQRASPSFDAVSSNKKKLIAGAAAVIFLGCVMPILLRDMLSRRAAETKTPALLMRLPEIASGERRGGEDRIEQVRTLALRIQQNGRLHGGTALFTMVDEETSPTELVVETARCLALRGETVLVLDAGTATSTDLLLAEVVARPAVDPATAAWHDWTGMPAAAAKAALKSPVAPAAAEERGLAELLLDADLAAADVVRPGRDFDLLLAGKARLPQEAFASRRLTELLDELHARYSMVLVIGPSVAQTVDLEMLAARVDSIVFVAPRDGRPLPVALRTIETLREADAPILGLVSV